MAHHLIHQHLPANKMAGKVISGAPRLDGLLGKRWKQESRSKKHQANDSNQAEIAGSLRQRSDFHWRCHGRQAREALQQPGLSRLFLLLESLPQLAPASNLRRVRRTIAGVESTASLVSAASWMALGLVIDELLAPLTARIEPSLQSFRLSGRPLARRS